jgi:DNA-binding NarL/FixJ family response regulator
MPNRATVLIVDDHPLVREGLTARVSAQRDMEVCGEAADVEEALELCHRKHPALMIVDLALRKGHGLDLIERVKKSGAATRMLVVSAYDDWLFAERALRAGAHGYINKQEAQDSVILAIRTVLRGDRYLSADMTQRLVDRAIEGRRETRGVENLTNRELEVFELIGRGDSTRAVAKQLGLSVHTIESHRENIREKLGLKDGAALARRAVEWVLQRR